MVFHLWFPFKNFRQLNVVGQFHFQINMSLFRPKLSKPEKTCLLSCFLEIRDPFLVNVNLMELVERTRSAQNGTIAQKLVSSVLLEAMAFSTCYGMS